MTKRSQAAAAAQDTYQRLRQVYPDAQCELQPREPFRLLVAVVLSAQTTDVAVNRLLPGLFGRFPDAKALAEAELPEVEQLLKTIGMYRQKAKHIVGLAKGIMEKHGGEVPRSFAELVQLPGVGRKTANVLLGVAYEISQGVVVDTHVQRLSQRLGWSQQSTPDKIAEDLQSLFPKKDWIDLSHVLIFHGRRVCTARAPACPTCPIADACPSAGHAEQVGRKPARVRK